MGKFDLTWAAMWENIILILMMVKILDMFLIVNDFSQKKIAFALLGVSHFCRKIAEAIAACEIVMGKFYLTWAAMWENIILILMMVKILDMFFIVYIYVKDFSQKICICFAWCVTFLQKNSISNCGMWNCRSYINYQYLSLEINIIYLSILHLICCLNLFFREFYNICISPMLDVKHLFVITKNIYFTYILILVTAISQKVLKRSSWNLTGRFPLRSSSGLTLCIANVSFCDTILQMQQNIL